MTYLHTAAELAAIVDSRTDAELTADGWTAGHGASAFGIGDEVYAYVRGSIRRGKVAKIGRTNLTVECTTPGAIDEAARRGWSEPCLTAKVVKIAEVYAHCDAERYEARVVESAAAAPVAEVEPVVEVEVTHEQVVEVIAEADAVLAEADAVLAQINREAWLTAAVDKLRPVFAELPGVEVPATVRVSVGWPGGKSIHKTIGQCWATACGDGDSQVFVSPLLVDPVDVLGVLVHELIHAWDDCQSGHKGAFARTAKALGLTGKMTATTVGDELRERLAAIAAELGDYPHKGMTVAALAAAPKQSTRMIKVVCDADGYTLRTTRQWLDVGLPTCPCGAEMVEA